MDTHTWSRDMFVFMGNISVYVCMYIFTTIWILKYAWDKIKLASMYIYYIDTNMYGGKICYHL